MVRSERLKKNRTSRNCVVMAMIHLSNAKNLFSYMCSCNETDTEKACCHKRDAIHQYLLGALASRESKKQNVGISLLGISSALPPVFNYRFTVAIEKF